MIQDGKKEEMQETVEEIWAMSYSVIAGIISANTTRGLPPMTVFLKNEYGKEKTDQEIDDAALTNLKNIKPLVVLWKMASTAGFRYYKVLAVVFTKRSYIIHQVKEYLVLYNVCTKLFYLD